MPREKRTVMGGTEVGLCPVDSFGTKMNMFLAPKSLRSKSLDCGLILGTIFRESVHGHLSTTKN